MQFPDGTKEELLKLERPQVLFEKGQPTHVFLQPEMQKMKYLTWLDR
jgi:hypothetical protein